MYFTDLNPLDRLWKSSGSLDEERDQDVAAPPHPPPPPPGTLAALRAPRLYTFTASNWLSSDLVGGLRTAP